METPRTGSRPTTIGVLALQGAFAEHLAIFRALGVQAREIRLPSEMGGLAGLVIPGGESTAIGLLAREYGLIEPIRAFAGVGAIWGTCAGAILLSRRSFGEPGDESDGLGLLDVTVRRNAFGRQVESFRANLVVPALAAVDPGSADRGLPSPPGEGKSNDSGIRPFPGIFIRAPLFEELGSPGVEILARLGDGSIVAVRQNRILATSFHPELTADDRFHRFFLTLVRSQAEPTTPLGS